jgi:hypothetical protein
MVSYVDDGNIVFFVVVFIVKRVNEWECMVDSCGIMNFKKMFLTLCKATVREERWSLSFWLQGTTGTLNLSFQSNNQV